MRRVVGSPRAMKKVPQGGFKLSSRKTKSSLKRVLNSP
jgi:hypothetical protein